ncbi:MAG TPA: hypothetical protein VFG42_09170 [Baekduia sp.]|uniref:hypothetical protein n=1 Tax=Baekduia sp. TaxID=2600305 RepID=UPI002D77E31A|nr:hypothetical protein [Baekduia sp.]HET6506947.1 hypothetical protein [Baekduia sp.]
MRRFVLCGCALVAAMPAQSRITSSLGDLGTACLGWQQAGMTSAQIATRVAYYGSAAALAWLLTNATAVHDGLVPPPATPTDPVNPGGTATVQPTAEPPRSPAAASGWPPKTNKASRSADATSFV